MNTLALFGGDPVRTREFRSRPMISDEEINLVTKLMREGRLSRFVGAPVEGTRDLLKKKSLDLLNDVNGSSFLGGEYVRKFEAEWSRLIRSDFCISVNSATSGLTTALIAMDVGPGCEVITSPFTFTATAGSIITANAIPVFCDIDPETFCISPESLEKSITGKTTCIMPVHWCGNAGNLEDIISISRKFDLKMIEDAAQVPATLYKDGQYLGTYGEAGVFSFNEPKNIMTGEGGIIVTDNQEIAEKCRLIRNHGEAIPDDYDSDEYVMNTFGYNFRLTEIPAAIGCAQIKKIDRLHSIRSENYRCLRNKISEKYGDFIVPQKITHPDSYYAYTAAFRWFADKAGIHRDAVAAALKAEGIPVVTGIPRLLCDHPMFKRRLAFGKNNYPWPEDYNIDYCNLDLPHARRLLNEEYLGFFQMGWPNTTEDMDDIVKAFDKIMDNRNALADFKGIENKQSFITGR